MVTFDQWSAILKKVPHEKKHAFIEQSLEGNDMLHIFGRYFFPHVIKSSELVDVHVQFCEWMGNDETGAGIMPRGHAKTTWARIKLIHDIVYKKESFIVFVGDALSSAKRSLNFCRIQLESNTPLRDVYGNIVPRFSPKTKKHWNDEQLDCTNGVVCLAIGALKGRGLNIDGGRPTKALIDDMEDKERVKSEAQRQKLREWMYDTLMPAMDRETGKIKMIGTVLHFDCLVLEFYKKFGGIRRAAIEDENGEPSLDGKPIWWFMEDLEKIKKQIGSFAFAQEYMNDPSTDENSDVKMSWIKRVDHVKLVDGQNKQLYYIFSALDPSVGQSQTSDESAIATVALKIGADDVDITVLSCEHGRWNLPRTIDECKRVFDRYHHKEFGIEVVAFQEHLRELVSKSGIPAKPIKVHKDKRARLQEIVGYIEYGNIKFAPNCEDLITQLIQFPNADHDDRVDAFVHAVKMALQYVGGGFKPVVL